MAELAYILAASHSGSTLLALLLGSHPDAVTVGELAPGSFGDVETYRCACRRLILECPFWINVAAEMRRAGSDFSLAEFHTNFQKPQRGTAKRLLRPLHRGRLTESVRDAALALCPAWRAEAPVLRRNFKLLVETVAKTAGRRVVVDSSKRAVQLKYILRIQELRTKVIRLIRDGRGAALGYMDPASFADAQEPALRGGGNGASRDSERRDLIAAAREWRRSNEEAEQLLATLPRSQWLEVRYEDLCDQPEQTLRSVFGFLGLDPSNAVLDFRSVEHHAVGNGMRLDATSEIRRDERWKSCLTRSDLQRFDSVAGSLRRRYSYA
jgi:hypothetical protein